MDSIYQYFHILVWTWTLGVIFGKERNIVFRDQDSHCFRLGHKELIFLLRIGGNNGHKDLSATKKIELMAPNESRVNISALTIYMRNKLQQSTSQNFRKHYIYRVNKKFRKINPNAYTPEIVSIGPFHRKQGSLRAMEEHKLHCVKTFLQSESRIEECIAHMSRLVDDARSCYESVKLDDNAFVEMMILDGFFIIDLFQKYDWQRSEARQQDPLLNNLWSIASLKRDILLLENQIPMSVLVNLLMFTKTGIAEYSIANTELIEVSLRFFDGLIVPNPYNVSSYGNLEGKHLLDLLGNTLHPSSPAVPLNNNLKTNWKSVPSVTELTMAGVKFKKADLPTDRLLDIKYSNGTIEIPPIVIHDLTETLLRNLIVYEQCSHQKDNYMISYAFFMDSLINSEEDVRILCEKEIIVTALGNNREVCDLFNTLCNEATLENFYYSGICYEVNKYYNRRWNRWMALLNRDYFQNPWSILSVIAAVVLLILTVIQTYFTVFPVSDNKTNILELLHRTG